MLIIPFIQLYYVRSIEFIVTIDNVDLSLFALPFGCLSAYAEYFAMFNFVIQPVSSVVVADGIFEIRYLSRE